MWSVHWENYVCELIAEIENINRPRVDRSNLYPDMYQSVLTKMDQRMKQSDNSKSTRKKFQAILMRVISDTTGEPVIDK